jgi:hypothetical protein
LSSSSLRFDSCLYARDTMNAIMIMMFAARSPYLNSETAPDVPITLVYREEETLTKNRMIRTILVFMLLSSRTTLHRFYIQKATKWACKHQMSSSANSAKNTRTNNELVNDRIEQAIDAKKHQMRGVLKEVERNTQISFQGHIDYHKYLMQQAMEKGDIASAMHHKILMETYQSILNNFSLSDSYDHI